MTQAVAVLADIVSLAAYILWLLSRQATPPAEAPPVASLPDLSDWEEPDTFRTHPALAQAAQAAIAAAEAGQEREAWDALSRAATATGEIRARWIANTIHTAALIDPRVAMAVIDVTRVVLADA